MKKLLLSIALVLPAFALVGCGGPTENTTIDGESGEDAMTDQQQQEYEDMMNSGAGGSSPNSTPGN
ncbi:MAG: hypothetical protein AAGG48_14785 [Planctomycetota bacterium]